MLFLFSAIVLSWLECLNSLFVRQILIYCQLNTYPGTVLTLFLIFFWMIFSRALSLLLISSKNKLFFPIDHFYCFHSYYFISWMSTFILINLPFSPFFGYWSFISFHGLEVYLISFLLVLSRSWMCKSRLSIVLVHDLPPGLSHFFVWFVIWYKKLW